MNPTLIERTQNLRDQTVCRLGARRRSFLHFVSRISGNLFAGDKTVAVAPKDWIQCGDYLRLLILPAAVRVNNILKKLEQRRLRACEEARWLQDFGVAPILVAQDVTETRCPPFSSCSIAT